MLALRNSSITALIIFLPTIDGRGHKEWGTFRGETGIAEMIQDLNTM